MRQAEMNPFLPAVNQKLLFAGKLAEALKQPPENPHRSMALCQSMAFQMILAYRFHLGEIAANYQCRSPEQVRDLDSLRQALAEIDKWPAEAEEMADLLGNEDSWLSQLHSAFDALQAPPAPVSDVEESREGFIAVADASRLDRPVELSPGKMAEWLADLQEMIDRHRDVMVEF